MRYIESVVWLDSIERKRGGSPGAGSETSLVEVDTEEAEEAFTAGSTLVLRVAARGAVYLG